MSHYYFRQAYRHKAAGKKVEAKQCKQRFMLCSLCSGRRPHSHFGELWIGVGTGMSFSFCPLITAEMRLPVSWVNSMAVSCHLSHTSCFNGKRVEDVGVA